MDHNGKEIDFAITIIKNSGDYTASSIAEAATEISGVMGYSLHPETSDRAWLYLGHSVGVDIDTSNDEMFSITFYEGDNIRYYKEMKESLNDANIDRGLPIMMSSIEQIAQEYSLIRRIP